ncbi:hypothetical protein GAYE_SCF07G2908 [Galdieria yellowstonensis]|uniref:BOP1 N-terminal domain-containing protein n=1 Tax=Galdieria yellowstonensis TaxID=3028027 RepID=A0AAV9ICG4_9RHOD|nr:hypothetical protein GAYE_SCF07G2908 [Galdieria yellowstonensis]
MESVTRKNILELEERFGDSSSSSDEETNTIGNVPIEWYKDLSHVGYTRSGTKLLKKHKNGLQPPVYVKKGVYYIYDEKNEEEFALSRKDLKKLVSIVRLQNPSGTTESGFVGEEVVFWTGQPRVEPVKSINERKRSFLPSRYEAAQVVRLVRTILRRNRMNDRKKVESDREDLSVWEEANADQSIRQLHRYLPPPKKPLPSHEESYRPPAEFLFEQKRNQRNEEEFLPESYNFLRHVPVYTSLIREHFERCLELYLAPRMRKTRRRIDPESLIPKLPSPESLRPFPDSKIASFGPHIGNVLSISLNSSGQWLACACKDGSVVLWEVATGMRTMTLNFRERLLQISASLSLPGETSVDWEHEGLAVLHVAWSSKENDLVLAVCIGHFVIVVNLANVLYPNEAEDSKWFGYSASEDSSSKWREWDDKIGNLGKIIVIEHSKKPQHVRWHQKGDYFVVMTKDAFGSSLIVHQLSRKRSQSPFSKSAKGVLTAEFHPFKSLFFIATKHHIRIYDLAQAKLVNKLVPGVSEISAMSVHPSGNHVLVGSVEGHLIWFDLDLSCRPYKRIRDHNYTVSSIVCHPTLALFADTSDDETVAVFHATVYEDLLQNPLIVPLKILKASCSTKGKSTWVMCWHPHLPWLFVSVNDGYVRLYADTS